MTKSMLEFAGIINSIPKIVFSKTLKEVSWNNTRLINGEAIEEIMKLKNEPQKNVSVGGLSFASYLLKNDLIDEFWFLIQPIILGNGKHLFNGITNRHNLKLVNSKTFNSGVVALNYKK